MRSVRVGAGAPGGAWTLARAGRPARPRAGSSTYVVALSAIAAVGIGLTGAYALYALAAAISLPFVWAAVRETRGKKLEEM